MRKILISVATIISFLALGTSGSFGDEMVQVVSYVGNVQIKPAGQDTFVTCKPGLIITPGTRITTGNESHVVLAFDRAAANTVKVRDNSDVIVKLNKDDEIELVDGTLFTMLRDMKKGEKFQVRTPCAVCGARGTGWETVTDGETSEIAVFDGEVTVRGIMADGSVMETGRTVGYGFEIKVGKNQDPGDLMPMPADKLRELRVEAGVYSTGITDEIKLKGTRSGIREEMRESIQDRRVDERRSDRSDRENRPRPRSEIKGNRLTTEP